MLLKSDLFMNTYGVDSDLLPLQVRFQPQSSLKPLSVRLQFTEKVKVSRLSVLAF